MRFRSIVVSVVFTGALLAGCGSSPASSAPKPAARGVQLTASSIPWGSVGSGWLLATWNRNRGTAAGERAPGNVANPIDSLFLVDPVGGRYLITRASNDAVLLDWSGGARRALLVDSAHGARFEQVDLTTGRTTPLFTLPTSNAVFYESAAYTRPTGLALLVTTQTNDAQLLRRYSLSGSLQLTYPKEFSAVGSYMGSVLSSPDGLRLAMGASHGVAFVDNNGAIESQVRVGGASYCQVKRWWTTTIVLATCAVATSQQQLFKIPVGGGTATALTAPPRVGSSDAGDLDAWQLGSAVYLQDAGGCGYQYLAKLQPSKLTAPVAVPDVVRGDSVFVVGTSGSKLSLLSTVACGGGESALWFDASKRSSVVVLGPPLNGGGVQVVLPYPDGGS